VTLELCPGRQKKIEVIVSGQMQLKEYYCDIMGKEVRRHQFRKALWVTISNMICILGALGKQETIF
jgi:hypothetical protein